MDEKKPPIVQNYYVGDGIQFIIHDDLLKILKILIYKSAFIFR